MAITNVSDTTGIINALLASPQAGDRILCAAGVYSDLTLNGGAAATFPDRIYIEAANPADPPIFRKITFTSARNVELRHIKLQPLEVSGRREYEQFFPITNCTNITLRNCTFVGANTAGLSGGRLAEMNGYGNGGGPSFFGCSQCSIINCTISNFSYGCGFNYSNDCRIEGTEIYDIMIDVLTYNGCHRLQIVNNYFHDHLNGGDDLIAGYHSDNIQGTLTDSWRDNKDITIHGNRIFEFRTGVDRSQSIFGRVYNSYLRVPGTDQDTAQYPAPSNSVTQAWASGTNYVVGNVCSWGYTPNDETSQFYGFVCIQNHNSSTASTKPLEGASWQSYWTGPHAWRRLQWNNFTVTDNVFYGTTVHGVTVPQNIGRTVVNNNTILANENLFQTAEETANQVGHVPAIWLASGNLSDDYITNFECKNNVAYYVPLIGDKPAAATWDLSNNKRVYTADVNDFYTNGTDATQLSDLQAKGTVLSNNQGSFWTLPRKFGGSVS